MMRTLLVLLILLLTACGGGSRAVAPVSVLGGFIKSTVPTQQKVPKSYTVKKGDTLYSISWRYGLDYKQVARNNNIRSPYKIYVGQKLTFATIKARSKQNARSKQKPANDTKKTKQTEVSRLATSNQSLVWHWPTKGKVISTYSKKVAGRKGINIAGKSGQQIVAAASGKVVYSGNGLPRYGNLLIIKHNDVYLSAYAYNKVLLAKEGQYVKAGQKIALLGRTGTQQDQLHFEIRRNGKPVDPLKFLPKK